MKFTFTCKKVALNDSVKEYAEKKISKLDRYFREDADALVTFAVEKDNRCVVEVTIRGGGTIFRAQEETRDGDIRSIIDAASATIDRQIRKNRTRLSKRLRQDALVPEMPAEFEVKEEQEFEIVRTYQAYCRKAHGGGGGHSADESAGSRLLRFPQSGACGEYRLPPQERRLRPAGDRRH